MSRKVEAERVSQMFFYGSLLLIGYLAYRMLQPFLVEIGWAVVLAIVLDPIRVRLDRRLGPTRTALVLTVLVVVLLVIPVVFVGTALVSEGGPAVAYLEGQLQNRGGPAGWLHETWQWLRDRLTFLPAEEDVIGRLTESVGRIAGLAAGQAGGILKGVVGFLFSLVIMLAVLFFMIRDAPAFAGAVRRVLPFGAEQNERLFELVQHLVSASVTSTLAIAALQGLIGGLTFAVLGIPGAVLWGVMMGIFALLPVVGASLVWLPAAVWLAFSGSLTSGIVLLLVGVLVLGNVDNVVRPWLLSGTAKMNTLVLILSLMGGVSAFGFIGIVLGPLVAAILTALIESYHPAREAAGGPKPATGEPSTVDSPATSAEAADETDE
jgi:predicted PurR-regulated permease PerM